VLVSVFPCLAQGFLADRQQRRRRQPIQGELDEVFAATQVLLYRLLFLLYAEGRGLLRVREACYHAASLQQITEEIAERAGVVDSEVRAHLDRTYSGESTVLFDRLTRLFRAMDTGVRALGLPARGGLFGERRTPLEHRKVPDRYLAAAVDGLAREKDERNGELRFIDYRSLEVRHLGSIYERLLECRLRLAAEELRPGNNGRRQVGAGQGGSLLANGVVVRHQIYLARDRAERKASGAYYTPEAIVEYIVAQSVGPVLEERLARLEPEFGEACKSFQDQPRQGKSRLGADPAQRHLVDRLFDLRVLDPAMGSGHFLVAAARFIAERLLRFISQFAVIPITPALESAWKKGVPLLRPDRLGVAHWIKRQVVERCLFGVDLNPMAVELARMSLWLEAGGAVSLDSLQHHLRYGNSLIERDIFPVMDTARGSNPAPDFGGARFDCVIGNPPHGAVLDGPTKKVVNALWPLTRSNADTAIAFIEQGLALLGDHGRLGLVVPKPLTYSFGWRGVRRFLDRRLRRLLDASRAWPEVRLEQVVIIAGREERGRTYHRQTLTSGKFSRPLPISWHWANRFDTLPCALTRREERLLKSLNLNRLTVGDLCKTFRGIGCQRSVGRVPGVPIIGGRDLARWRIRSLSGYVPDIDAATRGKFTRPKLIFQNIIAHIANPSPHIALIGAYDPDHTLTLDTVNNIVAKEPGTDLLAILALLHSELVNWFVYAVVYNKAIRTMHFDQYFLDKIPLPARFEAVQEKLAALARKCLALGKASRVLLPSRTQPQRTLQNCPSTSGSLAICRQIDKLVAAAYGVPPNLHVSVF
jgi:hypothetical protein